MKQITFLFLFLFSMSLVAQEYNAQDYSSNTNIDSLVSYWKVDTDNAEFCDKVAGTFELMQAYSEYEISPSTAYNESLAIGYMSKLIMPKNIILKTSVPLLDMDLYTVMPTEEYNVFVSVAPEPAFFVKMVASRSCITSANLLTTYLTK